MTAPSWSGERGVKIVSSSSTDSSALIMTPVSAVSCSPVSRSITINAPIFCGASSNADCAMVAACFCTERRAPGTNIQPSEPTRPMRSKATPQLGLEDDDQRQQAEHRAGLQDLRQELQAERLGERVDRVQDRDADDQADRTRAADQTEQPVDQQRGQRDVENCDRLDLKAPDQFEQLVHHDPIVASSAGSALLRRQLVEGGRD